MAQKFHWVNSARVSRQLDPMSRVETRISLRKEAQKVRALLFHQVKQSE
jgi:hypothetical protein